MPDLFFRQMELWAKIRLQIFLPKRSGARIPKSLASYDKMAIVEKQKKESYFYKEVNAKVHVKTEDEKPISLV